MKERIGKYEIRRKLGVGGFGTVWEAWDPYLKRRVAIKTCAAEDADLRARFMQEAEIAAALDHPNIVHVYDFGIDGEMPYLVEEFCEGEDLSTLLERIPHMLTLEQKISILAQVSRGLEHAHDRGVVHRDVKPGNIRVLPDWRAKLLDFGMARLHASATRLTRTGTTIGTVAYMAPEQVEGLLVGPAADLFSFGVTAYELFSGVRPFDAESMSRVFYRILHENPVPLAELDPQVPQRLTNLISRCLAKRPEDRPASASEVAAILEAILGQRTDPAYLPRSDREFRDAAPPVVPRASTPSRVVETGGAPSLEEGSAAKKASPGSRAGAVRSGWSASPWRWISIGAVGGLIFGLLGWGIFRISSESDEVPSAQTPPVVKDQSPSGAGVESVQAPALSPAPPAQPPGPASPGTPRATSGTPEASVVPPVSLPATTAEPLKPSPLPPKPELVQPREPRSPADELLARAESRFDRGDWAEAARLLDDFLSRFPDHPSALYASRLRTRVEERLGRQAGPGGVDAAPTAGEPSRGTPEPPSQPGVGSGASAASGVESETPLAGPEPGGPVEVLHRDSGVRYRRVPAGEAWIGCVPGDPDCQADERPGGQVTLSRDFYLAETETTVGQYRRFVQATGTSPPQPTGFSQEESHPVVNVSWYDARRFCTWAGGRLPTEAEWEHAARGGRGRGRYPWGDSNPVGQANAEKTEGQDRFPFTAPVGSFAPNGLGFYDLAGNVWEWVEDGYAPSLEGRQGSRDPVGPETASLRVLKGGSWFNNARSLRISERERLAPDGVSANLGFRCAGNFSGP